MTILNPGMIFPEFKAPRMTGIPEELKGYKQWTVWKLEQGPKDKKPTKVPYSPLSGNRSGSTEKHRDSWGSFDDACQALNTGKYAGIQFSLTEFDPFIAIDLDHCCTNGQANEWADSVIGKLDSYTEYSPSGTGIHILVRGKKPGSNCKKLLDEGEIEIYEKARLITITGHIYEDHSLINQDQDALSDLYFSVWPVPVEPLKPVERVKPLDMDDNQLITKIKKSKQGPKFESLMAGDTSAYANKDNDGRSEADFALCCILAYWTQKDPERIDRIFKTSQLVRPKWYKSSGEMTYGQRTIKQAIDKTRDVYNPVVSIASKRKSKKMRSCHIMESPFQPDKPLYNPEDTPWPETGSYYWINPRTGDLHVGGSDTELGEIIAQSPIWVYARAKNLYGEFSLVVKFFDYDHKEVTVTFPTHILSDNGGAVGKVIRTLGMPLIAGKEKMVNRYLDQMAKWCSKSGWIAEKIGWFEGTNPPCFVMPDNILGLKEGETEVFYQPVLQQDSKSLSASGTLKEWQQAIATPAKKNLLLLFGIMAGLAGPLNKLAKGETGGFHFCGDTSCGKTAIAQAAASVWGNASDPQTFADRTSIRKWKATVSGLEAYAQLHNDIVLCLDELGGTKSEDVGDAIYLLTGGIPKGRSQVEGGVRKQPTWHTLLISTGELTIEQIMRSAGQEQKGGQRHRMPDIRCDTTDRGIVADPDYKTIAERGHFVGQFKESCSRYYGTAGPAFVTWLLSQIELKGMQAFTDELISNVLTFEKNLTQDIDLPSEGRRMLRRLAIIGVAGFYASEIGIIHVIPDTIHEAIIEVRNLWLDEMEAELSEKDKTLNYFKHQVLTNIHCFIDINDKEPRIPNKILGYKNFDYIMILSRSLDELCGIHSKSTVLRELVAQEKIKPGEVRNGKNRLDKKTYLPNIKEKPRCYHIHREFFE